MNGRKKIISFLIMGAIFAALPVSSFAKELNKEQVDYVSLGDSLAAGQTPYRQLGDGYADYLVDRFEQSNYHVDLTKFGVSGFKTANVINQLMTNENGIQEAIKQAEVVTLDIGANDLLTSLTQIQQDPAQAKVTLESIKKNLYVILDKIGKLNPNANVYVMGYYHPFPHLPEDQQEALSPLLDALNQTIQAVSQASNATFVPTEKVIEKQEKDYIPNPHDIHLSSDGYQAVAKEFWKAIMNY
ncbi:GDSL-type esterase/lipase family protein [Metabacillus sp. Hm71]|uniref:GDSL-type esterase/lipase family protein n=1 Tax=Metabacillus sp. Hm71 TaxID=3450743 RepID=UPI003F41B79C